METDAAVFKPVRRFGAAPQLLIPRPDYLVSGPISSFLLGRF
jgi:hypothetical protein